MKRKDQLKIQAILSGILLTLFILSIPLSSLAKGDMKPVLIGESASLKSAVLNETRTISIHLPAGYVDGIRAYPVLYLLDGETHFQYVSAMVDYHADRGLISPMIVVGINNIDRNRDFTATAVKDLPKGGGAEKFIAFLQKELFPYIEKQFRVRPYRAIFGHSLGGLFVVQTLAEHPDLFNAWFAVSPYLLYDNASALGIFSTKLKGLSEKEFLYAACGDVDDEKTMLPKFQEMEEILRKDAPATFTWKSEVLSGRDHGNITLPAIVNGLTILYEGWKPSAEEQKAGVEALEKHFQNLSTKFGYEIKVPEYILNFRGYQFMAEKKFDEAIAVLKRNMELYPDSANVYDSLGEAYEVANQLKDAEANYALACSKSKADDPNLKVYQEHLTKIKAKLSGTSKK
jgi:uncharacterized protein